MNFGRIKSKRVRDTLLHIDGLIESMDYEGALTALQKNTEASLDVLEAIKKDALTLKLYNRQQWLVEAQPLVERLKQSQGLEAYDWLELALFCVLSANLEDAELFFKRALSGDKRSALLASELAILYEQQGSKDKALPIYEKIFAGGLSAKKIDPVFARVLARIAGLRTLTDSEIGSIKKLVRKSGGGDAEIRLLFALAKAHAKRGETDKEVELLIRANAAADFATEQLPNQQTVDASRTRVEAVRTLFDKPKPDWMPGYFTSDASPVFILGMPRSGTTLLEQILGAHSCVDNSGESRAMGIAFRRHLESKSFQPGDETNPLPFMRFKSLDYSDSEQIIAYYLAYQSLFSSAPTSADSRVTESRVTDKELSNIDRVGLIANFFPKARFVCIRRHPLDVCTSILQQDFGQAYFSSSSLKIAQEYEAYYQRAAHWQALFPDQMMSVEYETLVANFEPTAQLLVEFLGLEWEEGIKSFHERQNSVRTPSLNQVRSAVNTAAVQKWRRYNKLVAPAEQYLKAAGLIE